MSCLRNYPLGAREEAREALCAGQTSLSENDERSSHNRWERHFRNPWNLRVSNLFQPENVTIFVKMAYGIPSATRSPLITFL